MSRIIVYTGKGGVGKTSVAAATGLLAAERGYRTIVLSTDAAHSLADSFDTPLGPEPTLVGPNLWGQESDVSHNIAKYWGTIQSYVSSVFQWRGLDEMMAEEMSALPGMDELASLLWIAEHQDKGAYDVIVVDAAPTGETLRLLSLPEAGKWWIEKIYPIQRRIAHVTGPADNWDARERLRGYRRAVRSGDGEDARELEVPGDFTEESGYRAARLVLGIRPPPTAIFAANDSMAIGLLSAFQEMGVKVPGDIAVGGFDDIPIARFMTPPLSSVAVSIADLGARAMKRLLAALRDGSRHVPCHETLPTRLVARRSSGSRSPKPPTSSRHSRTRRKDL